MGNYTIWSDLAYDVVGRIVLALLVLIIGRWVAKLVRKATRNVLNRKSVDPTIVSFVENLVYVALMVFVILAALGKLGIQTASFVAIIGAAGLAIGLALQGSLSNFAAGFLLIIFRPFKVGDYIEGGGTAGVVEHISIFTTQLNSPDNKTIIIPNAKLSGDNIINYSTKETRRVDMVFGVSYADDIEKVKRIIKSVVDDDSRILTDPPVTIRVVALADNSINFAVRPWVKSSDYWNVYFDLNETLKNRFDTEGVSIPFPQRDVHLIQSE